MSARSEAIAACRKSLGGEMHHTAGTLADIASDVWAPILTQARRALIDASCLINPGHPDYVGILDTLHVCNKALDDD